MVQEREERFAGLSLDGTPLYEKVEELPEPELHWGDRFKFDQYDWNDPAWNRRNRRCGKYRHVSIPLTQGYFMFVLAKDLHRMTHYPDGKPKKWYVKVGTKPDGKGDRVTTIYAARRGRGKEPREVFAHREVVGSLFDEDVIPVDHINGWGLDNRWFSSKDPVNLRSKPRINGSNSHRPRTKNPDLPVGVEFRNGRYGGIYCRRFGKKGPNGKKPVRTFRSKRKWLTPEPAARWYQNQMKKLYPNHGGLVSEPSSLNFPGFPPRFEEEPSAESLKLRGMLAKSKGGKRSVWTGNAPRVDDEVPF